MAKSNQSKHKQVVKSTSQATKTNVKTSTMSVGQKRSFKLYRGQGR
jgi:hypothetical protein